MERLPLYIDFLAFRAPLEKSRGASLLFITLLWTRVLIISLIFLFPMLRSKGQSQPVVFEWQQCYGGSDWEGGDRLIKTSAGILISGSTYSNDGQVTGYHGGGISGLSGRIAWGTIYSQNAMEEASMNTILMFSQNPIMNLSFSEAPIHIMGTSPGTTEMETIG